MKEIITDLDDTGNFANQNTIHNFCSNKISLSVQQAFLSINVIN